MVKSIFTGALAVAALSFAAVGALNSGSDVVNAKAVAVISPTKGNSVSGVVTFTQTGGGVRVEATISGLAPNASHGFHVHQFGDMSKDDGTAMGGHFNPKGHDHALPMTGMRHVGDMGNLDSDSTGTATYSEILTNMSVIHGDTAIIGRGVVIHAKIDDGTGATGNAGARIGYGVVGVANDSH